jgi:RNA polymerase sigma-54 factor
MELKATPLQKAVPVQAPRLWLTPRMRQAIEILELPAPELKNYLEKELISNPLLEEDWPQTRPISEIKNSGLQGADLGESGEGEKTGESIDEEIAKKMDYFRQNILAKPLSLEEYLLTQTSLLGFSAAQKRVAGEIAGNLNDDGYLSVPLPEIAASAGVSLEDSRHVLSLIQRLDPPGIAARDLRESLLIQLDLSSGAGEASEKTLAKKIVRDHFEDLKRKKLHKIARDLKISILKIKEALACIRRLSPRPALGFGGQNPTRYVVPDVILKRVKGGFDINCRGNEMRLKINASYKKLLENKNTPLPVKKYLKEKLSAAVCVMRAVDHREKTIEKIVRWMVKEQIEFFMKGPGHLKPFTLGQAAGFLGFHKSTLSRALANKYIETPHGAFELKKLFNAALGSGDEIRSAADIQNKILELTRHEDKKKPLSDEEIVKILQSQGMRVARRTVAKYRQRLRILPSTLRKDP